MRIVLFQDDFIVGNITYNSNKVIHALDQATRQNADILVFPELSLSGYPPYDDLLRYDLHQVIQQQIKAIVAATTDLSLYLVFGYPHLALSGDQQDILHSNIPQSGYINGAMHTDVRQEHDTSGSLFNRALVVHQGTIICHYDKQALPNYQIFDEQRYFTAGHKNTAFKLHDQTIQLAICEDVWMSSAQLAQQKADWLLILNASPYHAGKPVLRDTYLQKLAVQQKKHLIYLNMTGAQDELVFDGGSRIIDAQGNRLLTMPQFQSAAVCYDTITQTASLQHDAVKRKSGHLLMQDYGYPLEQQHDVNTVADEANTNPHIQEIYHALIAGLQGFLYKTDFSKVIIGLSGGIDSAVTLITAVEALGKQAVTAVLLPYKYTADISIHDAKTLAKRLQVHLLEIPLHNSVSAVETELTRKMQQLKIKDMPDVVMQNVQARTRGMMLMALANTFHALLLTTGNKSEIAVGYTTLYGDMAGAFNPIKDLYKTDVYKLAHWLNQKADSKEPLIPERMITRAPTAELAAGQRDQDHLPPYELLDFILKSYIEAGKHPEQIKAEITSARDRHWVKTVLNMLKRSEHKRQQAAPGTRIRYQSFGRDWRHPIASGRHVKNI